MKKYDVVIIGGGTSGCACAYTCAKNNLKTLLVEKNNYLGGLMTGGLVTPIMKSSVGDLNTDYYKKLIETAKKYNAQFSYTINNDKTTTNDGWLNPELNKIILEDILTSDDVKDSLDILFETDIKEVIKKDSLIKSLILEFDILSLPIDSTYFVDATGNGKLSYLSKCNFLNDNEVLQQNSLRFVVSNVDIERFTKFVLDADNDRNITNTCRNDLNNELMFTTASTNSTDTTWALDKYLKKGVEAAILKEFDRTYFQIFSIAGAKGQVSFNCPRIGNYKQDPAKQSLEIIEGKKAIYRLFSFVTAEFPGFENAIITSISTQTGYREQRRLNTRYIYKKEDLIQGKSFPNPVLRANYGIDIHSNSFNKSTESIVQSAYELPIESLMSADIDNLFVTGKLVGAEFSAHSALRVQKSCMSMGEGVAKYILNNFSTGS